jgi:hypothetical protein
MNGQIYGAIFSVACLVITIIITIRLRRTRAIFITDYQAGVRFRAGGQGEVLPAGSYFSTPGQDFITVVDTRPYPMLLERVNCQDMLHANFLISIGAELVVRDPRLAVSSSKAYIDDAMGVVRERLSLAGSRSIVDPSSEGRVRMAAEISSELNRALETRGLEIRKLEITELWAQPLRQSIATGAN